MGSFASSARFVKRHRLEFLSIGFEVEFNCAWWAFLHNVAAAVRHIIVTEPRAIFESCFDFGQALQPTLGAIARVSGS